MKAQVSVRVRVPRGVVPSFEVLRDAAAGASAPSVKVSWRAWEVGKTSAARLKRFGLVRQFDSPTRLLIDHDFPDCPDTARYWLALRDVGVSALAVAYSKSPHGWHVEVELDREYPLLVRVALQMALGSDMQRERYNLMRALRVGSDEYWRRRSNVFYERSVWQSEDLRTKPSTRK